jgi:autotransporter-associated beta strand protein
MSVTGAGNQFLVGPVAGSGNLVKTGPGTLVMEGDANTFTGSLTVSAGALTARANKAVGDLAIPAGSTFNGQASLSVNQPASALTTLDGTLVVNSRGAADTNAHTVNLGRLTGSGLITTTTTGSVLGTVVVAGESAFSGVIEGKLGLTKTGASTTLLLSGNHTYSGPTEVSAGTLLVSGQLPAATALTLSSGATLARDFSLGALTVGTFTGATGSVVRVTGAPAAFDLRQAYAWPIVSATSVGGDLPTLDAPSLPATTGAYSLSATGGTLSLVHTPAPYAAWQLARDIPADSPSTADHDANGQPDLLDYALSSTTTPANPNVRITNIGGGLSLTFRRARAELTYEVEASSDLATWTLISTNPGEVGADVTVTDPEPLPAPGRRFLRVRVR